MGLAFGMCGYPREGGNKNSAQRKFTESLSLFISGGESACCSRQTEPGSGPTWLTLAVLARLQAGLCRLGTESGIASDIGLENKDIEAILPWVHVELSEWPNLFSL